MQCGVRSVEIVVMEVERKEGSAVDTGVVGASIGPLTGNGLDEAFGLTIGLGSVGTSEAMLEAEVVTGLSKEFGAVGRAAVGEDALDVDAVSLIEGDGLVEGSQDAGSFFIREEGGESQAGMIIDGDVEGLGAGTWIAMGTVAGGADAGLVKAAKLFNIKMKQLAGSGAFITQDRRFGRVEGGQAIEAMALEDTGKGSF